MTKHLADRLDRHSVRQRYRCGKCMAGKVEGKSLLDAANRCYLFEIVVALLITWYREQLAIRATALVFCQNLQRNIQEGHIYRCRGLLAVCAKPMKKEPITQLLQSGESAGASMLFCYAQIIKELCLL